MASLTQTIESLKNLFFSIEHYTEIDKSFIDDFYGFGQHKQILQDPNSPSLSKSDKAALLEFHDFIQKEYPSTYLKTLNSLKLSTLTSYFTPKIIVENIVSNLIDNTFTNHKSINVLEPSAGTGIFSNTILEHSKIGNVVSVEKDILTSAILHASNNNSNHQTLNAGFEDMSKYDVANSYDLIISNIPFGDYKVYDKTYNSQPNHTAQYLSQSKIHTYFFQKASDMLAKNGTMCFITTSAIADSPSNQFLRESLLKTNKLVSIVRLPNHVFSDSNTKIVSDLIIFQKRDKSLSSLNDLTQKEKDFISSDLIHLANQEYSKSINRFFIKNPSFVLGELEEAYFHNKQTITVTSPKSLADISEQLSSILKNDLSPSIELTAPPKATQDIMPGQQLDLFGLFDDSQNTPRIKSNINIPITISNETVDKMHLVDGNTYVKDNILYKLSITDNSNKLHKIKIDDSTASNFILLNNILQNYKELTTDPSNEQLIQNLNTSYDIFESKNGCINDFLTNRINKVFLTHEVESHKLLALEVLENDKFIKSDIFFKPVIEYLDLTTEELITYSLNKTGNIDLDVIQEQFKLPISHFIDDALNKNLLYVDPIVTISNLELPYNSATNLEFKYATKEVFLSGYVGFKKEEFLKHENEIKNIISKEQFDNALQLLEKSELPRLTIQDINPKPGEPWVPLDIINEFASFTFEAPTNVSRSSSDSDYKVKSNGYSSIASTLNVYTKGNRTITGYDLLQHYLHNTIPRPTYSVDLGGGEKKYYIDREAITKSQMMIEKIANSWERFLLDNPLITEKLETIYNNKFNTKVDPIYDGSHLELPGLNHYTPYKHQLDGVWQIISQNGGLLDHKVGAGKTLAMAAIAMELKRLNLSKKTLIIGMKSNTDAIYNDFKLAYPNAKVLRPTLKDLNKDNILPFFERISNHNWDAVIMTHQQFEKIPMNREIQIQILEDEIQNLDRDLKYLNESTNSYSSGRQLKGLEKRKENLSFQINSLNDSIKENSEIKDFISMGFEHMIVDESHQFKNLLFTSRHNRVAGLGTPDGSKRAFKMYIATRSLQELHQGDKGVTFASGTPISNSMVEMFLLKKYLIPNYLKELNITNFDSWAATFAELSTEFEIDVTNSVKPKERFRKFVKVPELARVFKSFTNIANDNNLQLDKPSLETHMIAVPSSELQKKYTDELLKAIQSDSFDYFGKNYDDRQVKAKMIIATGLATLYSIDCRLIDNQLPQNSGSKIFTMCDNVSKHYHNSTEHKGTQLIFCDKGTPKSKNPTEFSLYHDIAKLLVEKHGINENEIKIVHDYKTLKQRNELQKEMNNGNIRVLLGSTEKMGVGLNIQERMVAMHHLDIPWTPKDMTQRTGRGARQGNRVAKEHFNNKVDNYIYATENTLDAYKYWLLNLKLNFIEQIKSTNLTSRTMDEGDMDENGSMSPAAFIAQLSGNSLVLDKNKIDKEIGDLQMKRSVLIKDFRLKTKNIDYNENLIVKMTRLQPLYKEVKESLSKSIKITTKDEKTSIEYSLNNGTKDITDKEAIIQHFTNKLHSLKDGNTCNLGRIKDFSLIASKFEMSFLDEIKSTIKLELFHEPTKLSFTHSNGIVNLAQPGYVFNYIHHATKELDVKIVKHDIMLEKIKSDLIEDKKFIYNLDTAKFDTKIEELKSESNSLQLKIEESESQTNEVLKFNEELTAIIESDKKYQLTRFLDEHIKENPEFNAIELIKTLNLTDEQKSKTIKYLEDRDNNNSYGVALG